MASSPSITLALALPLSTTIQHQSQYEGSVLDIVSQGTTYRQQTRIIAHHPVVSSRIFVGISSSVSGLL